MSSKKSKKRMRVHREGYGILFTLFLLLLAINTVVFLQSPTRIVFVINITLSIFGFSFFLYFFRNPARHAYIEDPNLIVAPADGRVVVVEPTEEYECFGGKKVMQISIFMNVFSVHANWYPIAGMVKFVKHHSGRHLAAYLPKSSHENERSTIVIETHSKQQILLRQIAGALARRVVTYAAPNHPCHLNEHLGFIKFGSRVDLFIPIDSEVFVEVGESTTGNETIIARLPD